MPGRSLNDVWRQMQIQREAQQRAQQAQQRAEAEQRERARLEWVRQMKMNERVLSPSAAASSAAGAGGSGNRVTEQILETTANQATMYHYFNSETKVFSYFIYNFGTDVLTEIKELSLDNSPSIKPVTRGGFFLEVYNGVNSNYDLYFLALNGEVLWQDSTFDDNINNVDIEVFSRYVAAYYLKTDGATWALEIFDENSVRKSFTFDNAIEGGSYSYDDVWNGGFVVKEFIGTIQKYYIINFAAGTATFFYEIDTDSGENLNVYLYAYSDKILTRKNNTLFEVFNSSGEKLAEFDVISEFETSSWYLDTFSLLDDNGSFLMLGYDGENNNRTVIFYSGESNQFSSKVISDVFDVEYEIENQKNYRFASDRTAEGAAIFLFYRNVNEIRSVDYYEEAMFLPVWSTDSQLRDTFTFSSEQGLMDMNNIALTRSADYINLVIDNDRGQLYLFSDYSNIGSQISDGGDDMYDGGNLIFADDLQVSYSHTQYEFDNETELAISSFQPDGSVVTGTSPSVFGASSSSSYFTNLYPGLFVLAAQNIEIDKFEITGDLGADGSGSQDTLVFEKQLNSTTYSVFVKRVWGAQDPSVNHVIITNGSTASITQTVGVNTNDDLHRLTGLASAGATEIYYLLLALRDGAYLTDNLAEDIAEQFLTILGSSSDINELLTNLNQDYSDITDLVGAPDENYSILRFNRTGEAATILPTTISKSWRYDWVEKITSKSILTLTRDVQINVQTYGWDDLSDVESRFYYSLSDAVDNSFSSAVNSTKLVMKDTVNDKYWAIQFTSWGSDEPANFSWTRQLIEGGTFSGEVVTFTFSSWDSNDVDIIEPGVLEIKRQLFGDLYNSAVEGESNEENPAGTLWNSEFVFNNVDEFNFVIVGLDGNVISNVITTDNYDSVEGGATYILEDETLNKTWISNNQNNKQFTLINGKYTDFESSNDIASESGLLPGNYLIKSGLRYRMVTEDSISDEIIIPSTGETFTKIEGPATDASDDVFYNGFNVISEDDNNYNIYLYDTQGNLKFNRILPKNEIDDIYDTSYGLRCSVNYIRQGTVHIILFNGSKAIEVTTSWNNFNSYVNDYLWWY